MGCARSRFTRDEARHAAFGEDSNTVPYAYKASANENLLEFHPFDTLVYTYLGGDAKESGDSVFGSFDAKDKKWSKTGGFEAAATTLFDQLKALHKWAATGVDADKKTGWGKYNQKQVEDALNATLTAIAGTFEKLKWPEVPPAAAGGEGEEVPATGAADASAVPAEVAAGDAAAENEGGESEFPAALLKSYVDNDFFADLVKSAVVSKEIVPAFNLFGKGLAFDLTMGMIPGGAPKVDMKFAASVIFFFVKTQETTSEYKEIFWAAHFTDEDKEELYEALEAKDKMTLIFPGVIVAYKDQAGADGKIVAANEKCKNKITFKYKNGKYFENGDNFLIARLTAKIVEASGDDKSVITLEDASDFKFETVKAWVEKSLAA